MELPLKLVIDSLEGFCVCYFKDIKHALEAPPHYYITVPITDTLSLLICVITSQVEKKKNYYRNNKKALESLVFIDNDIFSFLAKKSVIDCNRSELISKSEFIRRINPNFGLKVVERDIPDSLKIKIIRAIKASPLITPYIKKLIRTIEKSAT